jgi:hypothetical protein
MTISNAELIKDGEALKLPCYSIGASFKTKQNKRKFAFSPAQLSRLVNSNKSLLVFYAFDSLAGLERGLRTDCHYSLSLNKTVLNDFTNNNLILRDIDIRALNKEDEASVLVAITKATST